MIIELFLLLAVFILLCVYLVQRDKRLPPGPTPLPIIGNLLQIALTNKKAPFKTFQILANKYGDVMMVKIGSQNLLILSSYDALKSTLDKEEWNGRIFNSLIDIRYQNRRIGTIIIDGDTWREHEVFTPCHLRDVGMGKASMERIINNELDEVKSRIRTQMGDGRQSVVFMHNLFNVSILNVLWTILAGERFFHDDAKLITLLEKVNNVFKSESIGSSTLKDVFPVLRRIFPNWSGEANELAAYNALQNFLVETIDSHRRSPKLGMSYDFIDIYLQKIDQQNKTTKSPFTESQLVMLCLDLFLAGSETTSNTLSFAFLYLILNPSVQEKAFEEIKSVVGLSRLPTSKDRVNMPYNEAVLMEVQRISSIAPMAIPHSVTKETDYSGYKIPKGTTVMINTYAIHMNKNYWGDPAVFKPERFIDEDGHLLHDKHVMPYGISKSCLGQSLSRLSSFLYFTTLLQSFRFETVPGHLNPTAEPVIGFTLSPKPYHSVITSRNRI